jgi:hypothetical protein
VLDLPVAMAFIAVAATSVLSAPITFWAQMVGCCNGLKPFPGFKLFNKLCLGHTL